MNGFKEGKSFMKKHALHIFGTVFVGALVVYAAGCTSSAKKFSLQKPLDQLWTHPIVAKPAAGAGRRIANEDAGAPNQYACPGVRMATRGKVAYNFSQMGGIANFEEVAQNFLKAPTDTASARSNLKDLFPNCPGMEAHLANKKPNIYIYFSGYGGDVASNDSLDEGEIMEWINKRDPNGIIVSMPWACTVAVNMGQSWCQEHATRIRIQESDPAMVKLKGALSTLLPGQGEMFYGQMAPQLLGGQTGYNQSLSSAIFFAAHVVNQSLMADLGKIHFLGYSMGAHAAADVLNTDFSGIRQNFQWSVSNCQNNSKYCPISNLKSVNWSLAMGIPGWSHALATGYNKLKGGLPDRDSEDLYRYENGGLLRIKHADYNDKLNVFNRRKDPTGVSDDTLQRGLNDIVYKDYNHYSHDYSSIAFRNPGFLRLLDKFLETRNAMDLKEVGILWDVGAYVEFDECKPGSACRADSYYFAENVNRYHDDAGTANMTASETQITAGVPRTDRKTNLAAQLTSASKPLKVRAMDQEDLRGSVEFFFKPDFQPGTDPARHALFSYGSCQGTNGTDSELLPQAYFEGENLNFTMKYKGVPYSLTYRLTGDKSFKRHQWVHLAFNWDLPTVPITTHAGMSPEIPQRLGQFNIAYAVASGLLKPPPTYYSIQKGVGVLKLYVNGKEVQEANLGDGNSSRECLPYNEVVSKVSYAIDNEAGRQFTPYIPYSGYKSDEASLGQPLGTFCKGFKIRNPQIFFGCGGGNDTVTAQGAFDEIWIVNGPGRVTFSNVGPTGAPTNWGLSYSSTPYLVK